MEPSLTHKRKILNDPLYGFITIRQDLLFALVNHPYFQRLRRISQLGLSHLVYPGAHHTRFHHALGAMHLMGEAIEVIRGKGHPISEDEQLGSLAAILLHDIGHGPFSHALEHSIAEGIPHEEVSLLFMERLNRDMNGALDSAIAIFQDKHPKHFLHQLVSSELDMDRLDYLLRDSFYSGVAEGHIGSERIIKMLDVHEGRLVVEEKGIYSIEKFIVARRLMYWQVYLHKTVLSAEYMLVNVLRRARELVSNGVQLWASPALGYFLNNRPRPENFRTDQRFLEMFALLDDSDILSAIKVWQNHEDTVLSVLCKGLINRQLFKVELKSEPIPDDRVQGALREVIKRFGLSPEDAHHFVITESIDNFAYNHAADGICLLFKDGTTRDAADASDHLNLSALSQQVRKYLFCFPR